MKHRLTITTKTENGVFTWLRSARSFDPHKHCAVCLIGGDYHPAVRWTTPASRVPAGHRVAVDLDPDFPLHYFCCVSSRGRHDNCHVPMVCEAGAAFRFEDDSFIVTGKNIRKLHIPELPNEVMWSGFPWAARSCRIWTFCWSFFPECRIEPPARQRPKPRNQGELF